MKSKIKYLAVIALLFAATAAVKTAARQSVPYGNVEIIANETVRRGDSVYLSMNLVWREPDSRMAMVITPVLADGSRSRELPEVWVMGKRKYKEYRRSLALAGKRAETTGTAPYMVGKGRGKQPDSFVYRCAVAFEPWMRDGSLSAVIDTYGCPAAGHEFASVRLADSISSAEPAPAPPVADARPAEPVLRSAYAEAYLNFVVAKTDIRPVFADNPRELEKIHGLIEGILGDENASIKTILITGYASPEGGREFNGQLSEGRAEALRSYLQNRYANIPAGVYRVRYGGEDWDGLAELLERSQMPDKRQALHILSAYPDENQRKTALKALNGGETYRYILATIYPSLRKVSCEVFYEEAGMPATD